MKQVLVRDHDYSHQGELKVNVKQAVFHSLPGVSPAITAWLRQNLEGNSFITHYNWLQTAYEF